MSEFTEDEAKKRVEEELHKIGTALESLCGVMALLLTWDDDVPQDKETK